MATVKTMTTDSNLYRTAITWKHQFDEDNDAKKAIAAAVFEQVSFNPAESIKSLGADKHPSPVMEWAYKTLGIGGR